MSTGFYCLPAYIAENENITPMCKLVYMYIFSYVNNGKKCFYSNEVLSKKCGITVRHLQRSLGWLRDNNYIKILYIDQKRTFICGSPLDFDMHNNEPSDVNSIPPMTSTSADHDICVTPDLTSASPIIYNINKQVIDNNNIGQNTLTETENDFSLLDKKKNSSEGFNEFWEIWPKKRKRAEAEKLWKANKLFKIKEEIIRAVEHFKINDKQWRDIQYIPDAPVFLRNKRWEDEAITYDKKDSQSELRRQQLIKEQEQYHAKHKQMNEDALWMKDVKNIIRNPEDDAINHANLQGLLGFLKPSNSQELNHD